MFTLRSLVVALLICFAASISFSTLSQAGEDKETQMKDIKSMTGDIICVLPMDKDGNVKAVIASGDCSGYAPHVHVFREAGTANVFSIEATPEKLKELEKSSERKGITLAGRIEGSNRGWILYVE
jgi:hypothetical protein